MNKYFSTGEFAKLCNVSKDTIRYYDKIGLLKPDKITENGYRYYSFQKYRQVLMIRMMQENDILLDEISRYRQHKDHQTYYSFIDFYNENLKQQQRALDFRIKCNNEIMNMLDLIQNAQLEECKVCYCSQEYFIATGPYPYEENDFHVKWVEHYDRHNAYLSEHNIYNSYIDGYVFWNGDFDNCLMLTKVFDVHSCDKFWVKPAGKYLGIIHKGGYNDDEIIMQKLKKYALENNLKIDKNFYCLDLITGYALDLDIEEYIVYYMVKIIE